MKKLNNKGYLTIEIILAATIAFTIAFFLMELTVNFSNISDNYYVDTIFITDKSLISNNLKKYIEKNIADNGIITGKNCSGNTCTLTFDDGTTKQILYDPNNKKITYDTYSKEIKNITLDSMDIYGTFEENTYIRILLSFDNAFSNGNYDINILIKNGEPNNLNLVEYITGLYNNADKTIVTNNSIQYNYANSVNLMNDRKGNTTVNIDAGNIRYYGKTPNNYIDIGDRTSDDQIILWRIIGVFDGKIRIVRDNSIGSYSWDASESSVNDGEGINEWSQADIMKLLNPGYEGQSVGGSLWWNSESGTCYNGNNNATTYCDFTSTGLSYNISISNIIVDQTISLGGGDSNAIYANQAWNTEKGTTVVQPGITCSGYKCNDQIQRTFTWTGKVALMYPSDYGYAADLSKCNQKMNNYDNSSCSTTNWILGPQQSFVNSYSEYVSHIWAVNTDGVIYPNFPTYWAYATRPVLTLSQNVLIKPSGDGSINKPYTLSGN